MYTFFYIPTNTFLLIYKTFINNLILHFAMYVVEKTIDFHIAKSFIRYISHNFSQDETICHILRKYMKKDQWEYLAN